jgi:TPR repeat protein
MGYAESQYNVCRLTAQGFVTPADYAGSIKWCSILAERGDEWGEYGMAQILENGTGGPVNVEEAAKWYEKSAEQGNFGAQFSLGAFYAEGKGVKRDLSQAYMWIALSGSGRHPDALAYLESLTAKMTPSQISTGQTLARKWLQDHPRDPEKNFDHIVYKPD